MYTKNNIAIINCGSQYLKLIDRKLCQVGYKADILPIDVDPKSLIDYRGIILSGSGASVTVKNGVAGINPQLLEINPQLLEICRQYKIPILGICFGMQYICHKLGGTVASGGDSRSRSDGVKPVQFLDSLIFHGLTDSPQNVLLTHGDTVINPPPNFRVLCESDGAILAMEYENMYGVQFHPEVDLTEHGCNIFENFCNLVCACDKNFTMESIYNDIFQKTKETVGNKNVVSFVSGGVDSTVCTMMLIKILGKDRVRGIHIDHGFMRKDESKMVQKLFKQYLDYDIEIINAQKQFLKNIGQRRDPEEIRKIIGDTFIQIIKPYLVNVVDDTTVLSQGTLRPDLIESASELVGKSASTIKTHHNDSPLVRELRQQGRVIEPLSDLHKDQVRELGRMLGIPDQFVNRHPFPGPGLAIRTILNIAEEAQFYTCSEKLKHNFPHLNVHLLPIRSVGVQGDSRAYKYVAGIYGDMKNFIDTFQKICLDANQITNTIGGIGRVVYIFRSKIDVIMGEDIHIKLAVELLRDADHIVQSNLTADELEKISQIPVIYLPLRFTDTSNDCSIVIRTLVTNDFMTGRVATPSEFPSLQSIVEKLHTLDFVNTVCYDLTPKPPGTTEWL